MSRRDVEVVGLSQRIAEAFALPAPSRNSMVYAGSWETDDLLGNLAKVDDIPTDQFIEWHAASLPGFTPEGIRHVLPYYMQYTLRHLRSEAAERLIFHLSPTETEGDYWRPRLAVFSQAQREAICAFFRFLEMALQGDRYESHFSRARVVWGCSPGITPPSEPHSTD